MEPRLTKIVRVKNRLVDFLLGRFLFKNYGKTIRTQTTHPRSPDTGFYYDIDFSGGETPGDADLKQIQKGMKKLINKWTEFTHEEVSADKVKEVFADNPYKLELIEEISTRDEKITLYTCGGFTDLCRGGHCDNPKEEINLDAFKLDKIAGAYWRGDEKNPMLTRIYGIAFDTKEELETYERQIEEAKARDHRKLGKELDLFTFSDLVGPGLLRAQ